MPTEIEDYNQDTESIMAVVSNMSISLQDATLNNGFISTTITTNDQKINLANTSRLLYEFFNGRSFELFGPTETILITIYSILSLSGLIANISMILIVLSSKSLRNMPYNILLLNLMIANILMAIFCIPFTLIGLLERSWNLGWFLCKTIPGIQGIGVCVSATTVTVIAIDRYIRVKRTYRPSNNVHDGTFSRVTLETITIWIIGIVLGTPAAYYQTLQTININYSPGANNLTQTLTSEETPMYSQAPIPNQTTFYRCTEVWPHNAYARPSYSFIIFFMQCIAPAIALIITSSLISRHLNCTRDNVSNNSVSGKLESDHHARNIRRNRSITKTLLIVSISFTTCWMPIHVLNLLLDLEIIKSPPLSPDMLYLYIAISHAIAMLSVPLNAILYGWLNPSINRELTTWKRTKLVTIKLNRLSGQSNPDNSTSPEPTLRKLASEEINLTVNDQNKLVLASLKVSKSDTCLGQSCSTTATTVSPLMRKFSDKSPGAIRDAKDAGRKDANSSNSSFLAESKVQSVNPVVNENAHSSEDKININSVDADNLSDDAKVVKRRDAKKNNDTDAKNKPDKNHSCLERGSVFSASKKLIGSVVFHEQGTGRQVSVTPTVMTSYL